MERPPQCQAPGAKVRSSQRNLSSGPKHQSVPGPGDSRKLSWLSRPEQPSLCSPQIGIQGRDGNEERGGPPCRLAPVFDLDEPEGESGAGLRFRLRGRSTLPSLKTPHVERESDQKTVKGSHQHSSPKELYAHSSGSGDPGRGQIVLTSASRRANSSARSARVRDSSTRQRWPSLRPG